jgi:hypothetical protein
MQLSEKTKARLSRINSNLEYLVFRLNVLVGMFALIGVVYMQSAKATGELSFACDPTKTNCEVFNFIINVLIDYAHVIVLVWIFVFVGKYLITMVLGGLFEKKKKETK